MRTEVDPENRGMAIGKISDGWLSAAWDLAADDGVASFYVRHREEQWRYDGSARGLTYIVEVLDRLQYTCPQDLYLLGFHREGLTV